MYTVTFEPITIGDNVYIGSNCLFPMGTQVASDSVVELGSVVVSKIEEPEALIVGSRARVARSGYGYKAHEALALRRCAFFDGERVVHPPTQ